jgi:hypothetical protein
MAANDPRQALCSFTVCSRVYRSLRDLRFARPVKAPVSRAKLLAFFGRQLRCVVALEACAGAHHWARGLARLDTMCG